MKVLQVNCVYKKGSTGKITYDLHKELLNAGIESIVCYGRGELVKESGVYKTCPEWYSKLNKALTRITGIMYGGCFFSTNKLISIIKKEQPDVVHLQCINGYFVNIYRLVSWLKKNHIKTVLTLHAEFMYTGGCGHSIDCNQWSDRNGCGHSKCPRWRSETQSLFLNRTRTMWKRMKKAFMGFDDNLLVTSVSPWLMKRAEKSSILAGKRHYVVFNGVDTKIFHPYNTAELRTSLGLTDEKIIFHATPLFSLDPNHIKGGYYVAELAKRMECNCIKIIVAGLYPSDIILPHNMIMLGKVTDQKLLAQYYSMADITLLTSQRETFSMVTAESLCCGTPVVGFKAGGPEQIAIQKYSEFVDYGNIEKLANAVMAAISDSKDDVISDIAKITYANSKVVHDYIKCYKELTK